MRLAEILGAASWENRIEVQETPEAFFVEVEVQEKPKVVGLPFSVEITSGGGTHYVPLPREIDTEKAFATWRNGVLCVTLPKLRV